MKHLPRHRTPSAMPPRLWRSWALGPPHGSRGSRSAGAAESWRRPPRPAWQLRPHAPTSAACRPRRPTHYRRWRHLPGIQVKAFQVVVESCGKNGHVAFLFVVVRVTRVSLLSPIPGQMKLYAEGLMDASHFPMGSHLPALTIAMHQNTAQ